MDKKKLQVIGLSAFLIIFFVIGVYRGWKKPTISLPEKETSTSESSNRPPQLDSQFGNLNNIGNLESEPDWEKRARASLETGPSPTIAPSNYTRPDLRITSQTISEDDIYNVTFYPQERLYFISVLKIPYKKYEDEAKSKIFDLLGESENELCDYTVHIGAPEYVDFEASVHPTRINVCSNN